jgi:hypothetical protein
VINTLTEYHLPIHGLIINKIIEEADSAALAVMRARQAPYIEELRTLAGERPVAMLFWLSVNWTFSRFELHYSNGGKVHE